jgi:hypothetical protein
MEPYNECVSITQEIMTTPLQIAQIDKPEVLGISLSIFDFLPVHLGAQKDDQHSRSMTSAKHIS